MLILYIIRFLQSVSLVNIHCEHLDLRQCGTGERARDGPKITPIGLIRRCQLE